METTGDRIMKVMNSKGTTPYKLSKDTGIAQSTIGRIIKNNNIPNASTLKLISVSLEVNEEWLKTGEGPMSASPKIDPLQTIVNSPNELVYLENSNGNKFEKLPGGKFMMKVPLVPIKAYARYINESMSDGIRIEDYTEVYFDVDQYARGNYMAFEIKGDSMDNGGINDTPDKATVLGRELGKHHWRDGFRDSRYGWVIVYKDAILCKDIKNEDLINGTITCHSRNPSPEYSDFTISLDDVLQVFKIIKRTF